MKRIACVVLLFVATFATAATTQRDVTNVEVVQVPVFVTAHGESVRGLTRDDFKLYVNGKSQPIDYFDVVDFVARADERPTPLQRRLYFFVFDLTFSNPGAVYRAQRGIARFVNNASSSDLFAVGAFSSLHGLEIVVPFTRDRFAVTRAVAALRGVGNDPLHLAGGPAERPAPASDRVFGRDDRRQIDAMEMTRKAAAEQVNDLSELADRLAPLEGQKHVVLLSAGFPGEAVFGGVLPQGGSMFHQTTAGQTGTYESVSAPPVTTDQLEQPLPIAALPDSGFVGDLDRMHRHFNAAGVVLDAVDVFGAAGALELRTDEPLYALSLDTGGTVITHSNDIEGAIRTLTEGQRVVYLLGFRPQKTGRKTNSIKVNVHADRGAQVVYRRSYSSTPPAVPASDALRLADILENDLPQTGVSVALTSVPSGRRASVTVEMPSQELAALGGTDGDAMIYIYSGRAVVAFQHRTISVEHSQLTETFDLPPGTYTAKVLVRWNDAVGFARSDFAIE